MGQTTDSLESLSYDDVQRHLPTAEFIKSTIERLNPEYSDNLNNYKLPTHLPAINTK